MKNKLFECDKEQKDLLNKVASVCGIKRASVQKVWEFTMYCIYLQIMEHKDDTYNVIPVPYLGKILLKESKEYKGDYDTFLMVFDSVKEQIKKVKKDDMRDLIAYFDENFIDKAIEDLQ